MTEMVVCKVTSHDNYGRRLHASNAELTHRMHRFDMAELTSKHYNTSINVAWHKQGHSVLKVCHTVSMHLGKLPIDLKSGLGQKSGAQIVRFCGDACRDSARSTKHARFHCRRHYPVRESLQARSSSLASDCKVCFSLQVIPLPGSHPIQKWSRCTALVWPQPAVQALPRSPTRPLMQTARLRYFLSHIAF